MQVFQICLTSLLKVPPHRHHSDSYPDRYGRGHRRDPPLYYIVPGGMSVIFQDQRGNMISR